MDNRSFLFFTASAALKKTSMGAVTRSVFLRCQPLKKKNGKKLFSARWNFPNCAGALDGKHIILRSPFHSGSEFYNYKGHSVLYYLL
ncbi:unnamed protein product [Acanthoscelides obtectus]|uniref:DDE Tnp4 domain-containing protein n=1 Tax=Acanthoscelides obtectus TaxID=200917 RepID=A0A9P0PTG8_ACAOB|nr:unnamed protein product [Acanthoscelides obtectus]CAK1680605.1 hypothetical protein AOBTE_LOCUS32798 [Acanthoscelides obtectus]